MEHVKHLVVGAGMSGLSFASAIRAEARAKNKPVDASTVHVIEADTEPGGYCKTIVKDVVAFTRATSSTSSTRRSRSGSGRVAFKDEV
ncbi:MAG: FAD/NAD(P)-binding protein [Polyangiaceae bacterium]